MAVWASWNCDGALVIKAGLVGEQIILDITPDADSCDRPNKDQNPNRGHLQSLPQFQPLGQKKTAA